MLCDLELLGTGVVGVSRGVVNCGGHVERLHVVVLPSGDVLRACVVAGVEPCFVVGIVVLAVVVLLVAVGVLRALVDLAAVVLRIDGDVLWVVMACVVMLLADVV